MGNTFKTALLLTAMTLLLLFMGQTFGGERGMMIALVFAVVMNFTSYFFSDKIALASTCHARGVAASLRDRRTADTKDWHPDAEDLCDSN